MASNAYLNFMGKADGESVAKGHEKWVTVRSWSWQVDAQTTWTKIGGASVGKPRPGALTFSHTFDAASPAILGHIATGGAFNQIQLVVVADQSADTPFTMTLGGVYITSVRSSYDGEEIVQEVDLVFKDIRIDYRAMDNATGKLSAPRTFSWDIPAGTASPSA